MSSPVGTTITSFAESIMGRIPPEIMDILTPARVRQLIEETTTKDLIITARDGYEMAEVVIRRIRDEYQFEMKERDRLREHNVQEDWE